ncbi:lectin-like domain-containing protein [Chromatium okenii]|uniref:lectin-like domain-containing protein n=1 Tax=Chromatium okenii TaxID=61644 RepID=UPI001908DD7B
MVTKHVHILCATALFASAQFAQSSVIDFDNFSNSTGLQLNGNTTIATDDAGRSVLRLTPASTNKSGSAFSTALISLGADASFSTAFQFRISNSGGMFDGGLDRAQGADGIVFVAQTVANTAGAVGGGIGYQTLGSSVGVEFDTWHNSENEEYDGNHVGIDLNGNMNSVTEAGVSTLINNGSIWSAWVDYNGVTDLLEVRLVEGANAARSTNSTLSYTVDLTTVLGSTNTYFGFTSGTGGGFGNHDILSWELASSYDPFNDVPEPSILALLSLGFVGIGAMKRREQRAS